MVLCTTPETPSSAHGEANDCGCSTSRHGDQGICTDDSKSKVKLQEVI